MGKKTSRALVCFEFVVDGWLLLFAFVLNFIVHCLLRFDNTIPNSSNPQLRSVSKKTSRALICFVVDGWLLFCLQPHPFLS